MDNRKREMVNAQGRAGTNFVEVSEMKAVTDSLNHLIATNRGVIDIYETAAARLEDEINVQLLQDYAAQHETFAKELTELVVSYSDTPETGADGSSLVKRAWVTLKATVTEGDGPILSAVAQDAGDVLETYRETVGADLDLTDDARELLREQMSNARLTYEKLSGLSAAYNH